MYSIIIAVLALVLAVVAIVKTRAIVNNRATTRGKAIFITYGSENFKHSKQRIVDEALITKCFHHARAYSRDDVLSILIGIGATDALEVMNEPRGNGYWIWKPFVILDALKQCNGGDIVVYADAGCSVHNKPEAIIRDLKSIAEDEVGLSHCGAIGGARREYNRLDVAKELVSDVEAYLNHNNGIEFQAGRLLICKRPSSLAFVERWVDVAVHHPRWFTDDQSTVPNDPRFKEHRHDQAVYNCIAFEMGVKSDVCRVEDWLSADRIRK